MLPIPQEPPAPIAPEPHAGEVSMDEDERKRIGEVLCDAAKKSLEELELLLSTDKGRACINEKNEEGGTRVKPLDAGFIMPWWSRFF